LRLNNGFRGSPVLRDSHASPPLQRLLVAAFVCGLLSPGVHLFAEEEIALPAITASIKAAKQELDLATQKVHATGNVRLAYGGIHLESDELDVDIETETIEARGNIKVTMPGSLPPKKISVGRGESPLMARLKGQTPVFEGEHFLYSFGERSGLLDNAKLTFDRLIFRGTRLELRGEALTVLNSSITTCANEERTHYRLSTRKVIIRPGVDIQLRRASFWLAGNKVLSCPKIVVSLREGGPSEQSFVPRVLINSTDGILVQSAFSYPLFANPSAPALEIHAGWSARNAFRGSIDVSKLTQHVDYGVRLAENDVASQDLRSRVLVDKRPEAFFDLQGVQLHPRLTANVFTSTGKIHEEEEDGDVTSDRSSVTLQLKPSFGSTENPSPFFGSMFARKSWYDDGMSCGVLGAEVGVTGQLSGNIKASLRYVTHGISGATPFEYDDIDIPHELRLTSDVTVSPKWKVPLELRYDLSRSSFRSTKIGILRRLDCLEYGATYDTSRRELGIDVRLFGFTGKSW